MNSIWLEHPEHPDYRVSPEGQVLSLKTNKLLKYQKMNNGYFTVKMDGKNRLVHRIVAQIYCSGFESGKQVNHLNGLKSDNRAENLEWVTSKENHLHAKKILNRTWAKGEQISELKESEVIEIYKLRFVERCKISDIASKFNTSKATVTSICTGKTWTHLFNKSGFSKKRVSSKFSDDDILAIRKMADPIKRNYREVAEKFNTSTSMISLIYNRKIWTHI